MQSDAFFGAYVPFQTVSKKDASPLIGADCLVGNRFTIEFRVLEGSGEADPRAWLVNTFGAWVGYFDADQSRRINILKARGWQVEALLALVAFTEEPAPGTYWGEAALLCFDPTVSDSFEPFVDGIGKSLARGVRPEIDLGEQGVREVVRSHGTWQPHQRRKLPPLDKKTVLIKSQQSVNDRIIELARARNKGCYVASWTIIIAFLVGVIALLKSCGAF